MSHNSLHSLVPSLQAIPVAMLFSKQLLLTQKTSVEVTTRSSDNVAPESHTVRATKVTAILKEIPCYIHGGLNE